MINELRIAVELVGKCPEEIQRIAAAILSVQAVQHETRLRLAAGKGEQVPRQRSTGISRDPRKARIWATS